MGAVTAKAPCRVCVFYVGASHVFSRSWQALAAGRLSQLAGWQGCVPYQIVYRIARTRTRVEEATYLPVVR